MIKNRVIFALILIMVTLTMFPQSTYTIKALEAAERGDFNTAIQLETEGIKILEASGQKGSLKYVIPLYNLATYYSDLGSIDTAKEIFCQIENLTFDLKDDDNYDYFLILNRIADYYLSIFDFEQAISVRLKIKKLINNVWEPEAIDYFQNLNQLSLYYIDSGNIKEAIKLGNEMIRLYKDKENCISFYATSLANLAEAYSFIGNYDIAINLVKKALSISEEDDWMEIMTMKNNLANYYDSTNNTDKAISIQKDIIELVHAYLNEDDVFYIASVLLLGRYYQHIGKLQESIPYIDNAKRLWNKYYITMDPYYAHILSTDMSVKINLGKYSEALDDMREIISIYQSTFGEHHPSTLKSYLDLLLIHVKLNNSHQINDLILNTLPLITQFTVSNFLYLPIKERSLFWDDNRVWMEILTPSLAYQFPKIDLARQQYNAALTSKGILINCEVEFNRFLESIESPELTTKYNNIKRIRTYLTKLYEHQASERYVDIDSLERHATELERQLMEEAQEFGDYTRRLSISMEDVKEELGEKDAAIEFVAFPSINTPDSIIYEGYILRKNKEIPVIVELFEQQDLLRLTISDLSKNKSSKMIWGKLAPYLDGVENVYFAPAGILHQVPIEYLPDYEEEGKFISDRYNLYRLSSTRELALHKSEIKTKDAAIYGGIQYDTDVKTLEIERDKYNLPTSRSFSPYYNLADSLSVRGGVKYLKYTLKESTIIDSLMRTKGYNPLMFTENIATEESFKSLSGKHKNILHISTHGFYWEKDEAEEKAAKNDRLMFMLDMEGDNRRSVEDKALTRTGLLMAGANNALLGKDIPENVDDGILTAKEIADLDLRDLDLVVLSACQTGMGDISSDGVFGLQRGFKKAGANSILMSLWDVDDEATQILMTEFYNNYLGGKSKRESLQEAQKKVRETPGFMDPQYWAAFILLDGLN